MRTRNRNLQKNQGSPSQRRKKKKNEASKSAPQRNQNLPIRNESEPSAHCFWAESSDKRVSAQYLRPNFQPIYHQAQVFDAGVAAKRAPAEYRRRELKRPGRDRREIELLTCQHDLIDERRSFLRQALAGLGAFRLERSSYLLGKRSAVGKSQVAQQA